MMNTTLTAPVVDHFDRIETTEKRITCLQRKIKQYAEKLAADQTNEEYVISIKLLTKELEKVQAKHARLLHQKTN